MDAVTPDITPDTQPTGPTCRLCGGPARVHWQRRLLPAEIADYQAAEQARRDRIIQLADPDQPPPVFGPLPDGSDCTTIVHGCVNHAISLDSAARVHQATCSAPGKQLPGCDCTPEAAPTSSPAPGTDTEPLPAGWG